MKLAVPYIGQMRPEDTRLLRLAEFLGITCEAVRLEKLSGSHASYLENIIPDRQTCLAVNPSVMQEWLRGDYLSPALASFLSTHFPFLLIHAPRLEPFHTHFVAALSSGQLRGVESVRRSVCSYEVAPNSQDICEAFAGLSLGPANPGNDRVFVSDNGSPARTLISLGGDAFMAAVKRQESVILFVGSEDVVDLDAAADENYLTTYFSRFLPYAMALRYIFGEESWRPCEQHASVIVDDPLLRRNYGFLNFESLLCLMKQHNFQTTVAFIPHNFRRSSPCIATMFRENTDRFALCYHGNDHLGGEFATTDPALLDAMLRAAERRMSRHSAITGLDCERVMVFPQGRFSVEAMAALKARNLEAAVNTEPYPKQQTARLTIGEISQPAVLRYAGFPLFLRKNSQNTQSGDIAFNLFFGRPILIGEHHDAFQNPQRLVDAVKMVHAVAPGIHWSNVGAAVRGSTLRKRSGDGTYRVRAYSRTVSISNRAGSRERYSIAWSHSDDGPPVESTLRNGRSCGTYESDEAGVRISATIEPGAEETFSVVCRDIGLVPASFSARYAIRAFARRRLSEVRDNYLSKNPSLLAAAMALHHRFTAEAPH